MIEEPKKPAAEKPAENLAQTLERILPGPVAIDLPQTPESVGYVGMPPGWRLEKVDDEQMLLAPRRTKALATLNDAPSFIDFVKRYAEPGTTVWCDFNPQTFALSFNAVIDEHSAGTPAWRSHSAIFVPDMSAEWKVWKAKNAQNFDQVSFAEFLEANEADIASQPGFPSSGDMMRMATDFQAKADFRVKSKVTLQSGGQALEYVNEADGETVERMALFNKFQIGIPIFWRAPAAPGAAVPAFLIPARLRFRLGAGKVTFYYELVRPDLAHQLAAGELIAEIREGIQDVPLVMGHST